MKTITINNKDLGFLTQEPITVQRFETVDDDGTQELVYCDHARSTELEEESLSGHAFMVMYCDKCPASKLVGESYWNDAPVNGKHEEDKSYD